VDRYLVAAASWYAGREKKSEKPPLESGHATSGSICCVAPTEVRNGQLEGKFVLKTESPGGSMQLPVVPWSPVDTRKLPPRAATWPKRLHTL
jgi:hypothetical protein